MIGLCRILVSVALVAAILAGRGLAADPVRPAVDFAHEVVPLLAKHCGECHTGNARQGGFSLNTRDDLLAGGDSGTPGIVPGDAAASELVARIETTDPDLRMPSGGPPLDPAAIAVLRAWIDGRAEWEPGFAFERTTWEPPLAVRAVTLPLAEGGRTNPVDRVVDAYWRERGVLRPPPSDDRTFIRRVSLDLVGLLPDPARVEAFVADPRTDKRARLVRELLGDGRRLDFAEHWLTFWNDLLRNDYSGTGFITNGRRQITGWLHRSLVENVPFDRFVRELIAPSDESRGFIDGIVWRGTVNASQTVPIQFAQNVGQTFLGINLKCASCHDSFVDRWTLRQTYDLAAVLAAEPLELHRCEKATGTLATPGWMFAELGQVDPEAAPERRLEQLAAAMTQPGNGWLSRNLVNRLWARLLGRGLVHPVDGLRQAPWSEDLLDVLAADLVASGWDVKHVLETICTSATYGAATPVAEAAASRAAPRDAGGGYVFLGPVPRRMTAEQFLDAVWQLTGGAPAAADAAVERPAEAMVRAALVKATPLMAALGRPNRDQVVTSRPDDLSTLEAIQLANEQGLFDVLTEGAQRLLADGPSTAGEAPAGLVTRMFTAALARPPTADEMALACDMTGAPPTVVGVADCLWAVMMLPEFQLIR